MKDYDAIFNSEKSKKRMRVILYIFYLVALIFVFLSANNGIAVYEYGVNVNSHYFDVTGNFYSYSDIICLDAEPDGNSGKYDLYLDSADSLVYLGVAFLSLGMLSGSLWAKQAWGTYWNWDPKETWAAVTWCTYLIYIHMRLRGRWSRKVLCSVLIVGFICLQMCWWGINYLPSARESVHTYSTTQLQ